MHSSDPSQRALKLLDDFEDICPGDAYILLADRDGDVSAITFSHFDEAIGAAIVTALSGSVCWVHSPDTVTSLEITQRGNLLRAQEEDPL